MRSRGRHREKGEERREMGRTRGRHRERGEERREMGRHRELSLIHI